MRKEGDAMNRYREMRDRQQREYNEFSKQFCFYAFSEKQFAEGMQQMNLNPEADREKVRAIIGGGFVLADKQADLEALFDRFQKEREDAIKADQTGDGFIYEMFVDELENHEFSYTEDPTEAVIACGLDLREVVENEALNHGLSKAMDACRESALD